MRATKYPKLIPLAPALLIALLAFSAAPAKPPKPIADDLAATIDLPDDANLASLRVNAIDTLYELDLSIEQLNFLRALAVGTSETTTRPAATVTPKFLTVLKNFQTALLDARNDQQIAKLRNQLLDLMDAPDIQLDGDIVTTPAARAKALQACRQLKASQLAAFLAVHAEEVSDPEELLMSTADSLQEMHAEKAADKAASGGDGVVTADSTIQETALTVGYLVAGMDSAKSGAISQQAEQWLRGVNQMPDTQFAANRPQLEATAKRIVGPVDSMQVLNNWMQDQMATLLSNPQLSDAVATVLKCRLQEN